MYLVLIQTILSFKQKKIEKKRSFTRGSPLKDLEEQLIRWSERLQQYNFEICHRKGRAHGNVDGLSWHP